MSNVFDQMKIKPFEPHLKYLYVVQIQGIPSFLCRTFKKPSGQFAQVEYQYINEKRYLKGRRTLNTVDMTTIDAISPSGAQAIESWLRAHHESITGRDGFADVYYKNITVKQLGPTGVTLQEWTLEQAFITSFDFGDLDYTDDNTPVEITITMRYNNYTLNY